MDITTSSIIVANTFPRLCHAQHGASTTIVASPDHNTKVLELRRRPVTQSGLGDRYTQFVCAESLSSMNFPANIKKAAEQTERTVHIKGATVLHGADPTRSGTKYP
jgi:hypothetical protein